MKTSKKFLDLKWQVAAITLGFILLFVSPVFAMNVISLKDNLETVSYIADFELNIISTANGQDSILKTKFKGIEVFKNTATIKTEEARENEGKNRIRVSSEIGANLRSAPTISSEVLYILSFGTGGKLLSYSSSWAEILTDDGKRGYVSTDLLESEASFLKKPFYETDKKPENSEKIEIFSTDAKELIAYAKNFLGKPYIFGGTDLETGTDCSGFTYSIFKKFGIELNRRAKDQFLNGRYIEKQDLQPADLIFFGSDPENITHIGIYIGGDEYIHSADEENGVIISSMHNPFSINRYIGARRVL